MSAIAAGDVIDPDLLVAGQGGSAQSDLCIAEVGATFPRFDTHEDGSVETSTFVNGQQQSSEITHSDGSVTTSTYANGQVESAETSYSDGSVKTTTYADGQPESSEIVYSDGMVMASDDLDADGVRFLEDD